MRVYYDMKGDEQQQAFEEGKLEFKFTIEHLGEEYLYRNFKHMYDEMEEKTSGKTRRERLQERMDQLEAEMKAVEEEMKEYEES